MAVNMYREYRLKFYLNMRHYIIINEVKGETHPHTWEFALDIKFQEIYLLNSIYLNREFRSSLNSIRIRFLMKQSRLIQ